MGNLWLTLYQNQYQLTKVMETNQYTKQFGLCLTEEDCREIMEGKSRALRKEKRLEYGTPIIHKIIYAFCDSEYLSQEHYKDTLIRLQEIFYLFKNEMLDELTDDELLELMRLMYDKLCLGNLDDLCENYLPAFAEAIRAGYDGFIKEGMDKEYDRFEIRTKWDPEIYIAQLYDLFGWN